MSGIDVRHEAANSRFVATVDGLECVVDYRLHGSVADFVHTGVPPPLEGRGIAAALVAAALAWAQAAGLQVRPSCSYVARYMQRHPETLHLLTPR
jgi:predicted GNAT family acetyltransferase